MCNEKAFAFCKTKKCPLECNRSASSQDCFDNPGYCCGKCYCTQNYQKDNTNKEETTKNEN